MANVKVKIRRFFRRSWNSVKWWVRISLIKWVADLRIWNFVRWIFSHPWVQVFFFVILLPALLIGSEICFSPDTGEIFGDILGPWLSKESLVSPIVSLFALSISSYSLYIFSRRNKINEDAQNYANYTRAVEWLGSESLTVRNAGVHALHGISKEAEQRNDGEIRERIMSVLASFVSARAPKPSQSERKKSKPRSKLVDVESAVRVLGGLARAYDQYEPRAHIANTDLRGLILSECFMPGLNLDSSLLCDSKFVATFLVDTILTHADLTKADLTEADLTEADLTEADLTEADLTDADLTGANLAMANFAGADLKGTDLTGTDVSGVDFRDSLNLQQSQLNDIKYWNNSKPKLPKGLKLPLGDKNIMQK